MSVIINNNLYDEEILAQRDLLFNLIIAIRDETTDIYLHKIVNKTLVQYNLIGRNNLSASDIVQWVNSRPDVKAKLDDCPKNESFNGAPRTTLGIKIERIKLLRSLLHSSLKETGLAVEELYKKSTSLYFVTYKVFHELFNRGIHVYADNTIDALDKACDLIHICTTPKKRRRTNYVKHYNMVRVVESIEAIPFAKMEEKINSSTAKIVYTSESASKFKSEPLNFYVIEIEICDSPCLYVQPNLPFPGFILVDKDKAYKWKSESAAINYMNSDVKSAIINNCSVINVKD